MNCMLGIDVGTSGCKIIAIDEHCRILKTATEEYPIYSPGGLYLSRIRKTGGKVFVRA